MKEVKALFRPTRLYDVVVAIRELSGMPGLTISDVRGFPVASPNDRARRPGIDLFDSFEMTKLECVVPDDKAAVLVETIARVAHTGNPGDGKIFVYDVADAIAIRTATRGEEAL